MLPLKNAQLFRQQAYINGIWCAADNSAQTGVINPATGELIGFVPSMGMAETKRAILSANDAWKSWRAITAKERSKVLRRWNDLILENKEDLAIIMTSELGKPITEARSEILYAASFIEWFAEEGKRSGGDTIPSPWVDSRIIVVKEPVGVCAGITPWNFPSAMITRKAGPALAAGCTVVLKPSESTPFSALALVHLAECAGFPRGVINVVTGDPREIGAEMTSNPLVRKLSFTGSTAIGRLLMSQCANTIKKLSLELGGNAPFIVFDDADIDAAVAGAMASKFRNAGQTCVCANRIYVQNNIYDIFSKKFTESVKKLRVGNGMDESTTQGPLINNAAVEKVEEHIKDAVAKGASILTGGKRHALGRTFFELTVLINATSSMQIAREETFGPLAPLFSFTNEEDVLMMANDSEFSLSSYFYSTNIARVWRVAEQIQAGIVGINTGIISTEVAPFGGIKQSGIGREGSKYGIEEYQITKYICMGGI